MKDIFIIVPTLNPNIELLDDFLAKLKKEFKNILVYDDGGRDEYKDSFKKLEKQKIIVLHHYINLGKGRAMKDAFNYLLNEYPNLKGVVTADSDGQHSVEDIVSCANKVIERPDALILGCRDFDQANVPKRNRFGNKTTRSVLKLFVGISVSVGVSFVTSTTSVTDVASA
jgi:dolichol-phosphate mannosyltransferase